MLHPKWRTTLETQRTLDLLLGRETKEADSLGVEVARTIGIEPARGLFTYHARYDPALILDLCWLVGASIQDQQVADLVTFVTELQGPYGLWEHRPKPQASRWLTFDLLRSLSHIDQAGEWMSLEPHTPFQAYPKRRRRY